jgi:hypothetical protein
MRKKHGPIFFGPRITMIEPKYITVKRARRILGRQAENYSDNQVKELLHTLQLLAREQLLYNGSKVKENGNKLNQPNSRA